MHKVRPIPTSYYKACTKYVTVPTQWNYAQRHQKLQLQNRISKRFLQGIFQGKSQAPKLWESANEALLQPWCGHATSTCNAQLQKTIAVLRK